MHCNSEDCSVSNSPANPHLSLLKEKLVCFHLVAPLVDGQRAQLDPAGVEIQLVLRAPLPPALPAHTMKTLIFMDTVVGAMWGGRRECHTLVNGSGPAESDGFVPRVG